MTGVEFCWDREADAAWLAGREWLATNGRGGYASATLSGIPTRRYHGLFVPNLSEPAGRHVLIGRFDEEVECDGSRALIGGSELADGTLESDTAAVLRGFLLDGLVPVWRFAVGSALIERSIVMPHGHNTVCLRYRLLEGSPAKLRLRPYPACRRVDAPLATVPEQVRVDTVHGWERFTSSGGAPRFWCKVSGPAAGFIRQARESTSALYRDERDRGYDHVEAIFSPGHYVFELGPNPATFIATTEAEPDAEPDGDGAFAAERAREDELLRRIEGIEDALPRQLMLAADQFLILPGRRIEEFRSVGPAVEEPRTVIAGYHWFGDWGRDTMISLEGLTLCTGRHYEAAAILRTFARYVRDGLLPNLFPEGEREACYNTVDATLWYFHAIDRYRRHTGNRTLLADLFPVLASIVEHHLAGTAFGIGCDPADGLLRGSSPGLALTWMDARFEDWVVTPRRGKPVEIQALWYNALSLMAEWADGLGYPSATYRDCALQVRDSFNARFWDPACSSLLDVVDGPDGDDASVRPNQIIALSLAHPVLAEDRRQGVLACVEAELLTPFGLRTLSPRGAQYCRSYHGNLRTRDAAYHQGTVWPWLLGHYIDALLGSGGARADARALLAQFPSHLRDAGIGSVSEIFDAEPPFHPRGCIAQAWSVAEILRAWIRTAPQRVDVATGSRTDGPDESAV